MIQFGHDSAHNPKSAIRNPQFTSPLRKPSPSAKAAPGKSRKPQTAPTTSPERRLVKHDLALDVAHPIGNRPVSPHKRAEQSG